MSGQRVDLEGDLTANFFELDRCCANLHVLDLVAVCRLSGAGGRWPVRLSLCTSALGISQAFQDLRSLTDSIGN